MKRSGIGITDPKQTTPAIFETSEHCCEVFTTSMINEEAMDLRTNSTQVREVCDVGHERRVDSEEGYLRDLQETVGKKEKRYLKQY